MSFKNRLFPLLPEIVQHFGTPFHIYDETGIRKTSAALIKAFSKIETFREYFAVKALPNPHILELMQQLGFGFDCSSIPELILSRSIGATAEERNSYYFATLQFEPDMILPQKPITRAA